MCSNALIKQFYKIKKKVKKYTVHSLSCLLCWLVIKPNFCWFILLINPCTSAVLSTYQHLLIAHLNPWKNTNFQHLCLQYPTWVPVSLGLCRDRSKWSLKSTFYSSFEYVSNKTSLSREGDHWEYKQFLLFKFRSKKAWLHLVFYSDPTGCPLLFCIHVHTLMPHCFIKTGYCASTNDLTSISVMHLSAKHNLVNKKVW